MTEAKPSKHRSRGRIYADILSAIQERDGTRMTDLIHKANMPYDRFTNYITQMEEFGLINRKYNGNTTFYITLKGREYLAEFRKFQEFSNIFGVEI